MKHVWLAALVVAVLPAFAMAEHRYDRGARYDRGYRDSSSRVSVSLGFSSGSQHYSDRSYTSISYSRSYGYRPVYHERVYVPSYSYCPPPRVIYTPPVYCPPPVVYYSPPVYYRETYCAPRGYVHIGYSYHR